MGDPRYPRGGDAYLGAKTSEVAKAQPAGEVLFLEWLLLAASGAYAVALVWGPWCAACCRATREIADLRCHLGNAQKSHLARLFANIV
jgi:hypothetical protein